MIADHQTNVVFVADTLERRFPAIYGGLKTILSKHGIPFRTIPGTRQIWCRDYMPVQVAEDRFVQFQYAPDYLTGKYRHLRADGRIGPLLPWIKQCDTSELVLDGGNVVRRADKAIVMEKVFAENPKIGREGMLAELKDLLRVETLVVIPTEPGDVVGHADGVVRFVNEESVLINDYRSVDRHYRARLLKSLEVANLRTMEIPYRPDLEDDKEIPSGVGNYVNFLQVEDLIVMPTYGLRDDLLALEALTTAFPDSTIRTLPCRTLADEGGVLNCGTWTISDLSIAGDASRVVQSDQARG